MLSKLEVFNRKGEEVVLDIELYPNYFLVCVEYLKGGKVYFEGTEFNKKMLHWILQNNTVYTFNGIHYDIPIVMYALKVPNWTIDDLYNLSQGLIGGDIMRWDVGKSYINWKSTGLDHVDLKPLCPIGTSLKMLAARLGAPDLEDLPYPFYETLSDEQKQNVLNYCWKDTANTIILKNFLQPQIDLRCEMSKQYQIDLRSKSDAQIAESVVGRELLWKHNIDAKAPTIDTTSGFKYNIPKFVKFQTKEMNDVLDVIREARFYISPTGQLILPPELAKRPIKIGKTVFTMGGGGLHSTENWIYHEVDDKFMLVDRDFDSFYPMLIISQGLFPVHIGRVFLEIYKGIVDRRLVAKRIKDMVVANTLKIVVNGSFGKFGNQYSIMYSPDLMIQTTVSGQLYLLMFIELMTLAGFEVFSGNTDGFVTKVPTDKKHVFDAIVAKFEQDSGLTTEETLYSKYVGRDVNNYLAIKTDGKVKSKGYFADSGLSKNPAGNIIQKAVINFFAKNVSVEDTVKSSTKIDDFLFVRKVDGGCIDQKKSVIGKTVRWYIAKGEFEPLLYAKNNNKVPMTDGARLFMDLRQDYPLDIDTKWYIRKAKEIVKSVLRVPPKQLSLFD